MKRLVIVLAILLATVCASAQNSLDGTWIYIKQDNQPIREEQASGSADMKVSAKYEFAAERFTTAFKVVVNMDFTAQDENGEKADAVFNIEVVASVAGTLSRDGSTLTLTPEAKKKPSIEVNTKIEGVPGGNLIKGMIVNPIKKELSAELKKEQKYKVVSLSETTLVLEDILSEKELKSGQKAQTMTLNRR